MARCPDCNKFTGVEPGDPELNGENLDVEGQQVEVEARLVNNCAECGTEIAEANLTLTDELPEDFYEKHKDRAGDIELELDDPEAGDRYQTTTPSGKPIKNSRYQKHYYTVEVNYRVVLDGETLHEGTLTGEEQASYFESLV